MNNLLGAALAPGFDDPLEMLQACHGRIQTQCATLGKLVTHLKEHGCDIQAKQAAHNILRYFDTAGRHHHDDEEIDLFPLLIASASDSAHALVARLLAEHKVMDSAWEVLRHDLTDISDCKNTSINTISCDNFISAYTSHIELENTQLLPLAKQLLTTEQLLGLGKNMAARRQS
ncbi:MAG: hemerythrin domain-containing protein [Gallionellaceae bacterium]|jgi:hemerythrin-like domain-containing protein